MIEITNAEVFGWDAAIRGMRNPMNSWDKSDSVFGAYYAYGAKVGRRPCPHAETCPRWF